MKPETFGPFPAARVLAARLDRAGDGRVTRKVSRLLQDYHAGLGHIGTLAHPTYRKRCALLWRDDFLGRARIDPFIDKYVRNVIRTSAKALLAGELA